MNSLRPTCLLFTRTTRVGQPLRRIDPSRHLLRNWGHDPWRNNLHSSLTTQQLRSLSRFAPRREEHKSPPARPEPPRASLLSRLPFFRSGSDDNTNSSSASFKKIVALARPERRPLSIAVGLLLVSSAVSLSIPFTVGRLIDYFSMPDPVRTRMCIRVYECTHAYNQAIPYGFSIYEASAILFVVFTIGGAANAGRAFLMKMSGEFALKPSISFPEAGLQLIHPTLFYSSCRTESSLLMPAYLSRTTDRSSAPGTDVRGYSPARG